MWEPLLSGEVWVAWDHTARVAKALEKSPGDFVVFPAPSGPRRRGFSVVLAGLAIPKDAPSRKDAARLIEYLTSPEIQMTTLRTVGFFPVAPLSAAGELPPDLALLREAVNKQASARDAIPTMLLTGLAAKKRELDAAYLVAFSQIVLRGADIRTVLNKQAGRLQGILSQTMMRCRPPDEPSSGPCPVEE